MSTCAPSPSLFVPGSNCWRVEEASRFAVIVDADAYFRAVRSAMLKARRRIMLMGWDFDPRITLDRSGSPLEGPGEVAAFLRWLVGRDDAWRSSSCAGIWERPRPS